MVSVKGDKFVPRNESVLNKTGKSWSAWFKLMEKWGAAQKGHKQTARYLEAEHGLTAWWAQTITVEYERARGLRQVGQRSGGKFTVSLQRTVTASPEGAFDAFTQPAHLSTWFTRSAQVDLRVGGRYSNADNDQGEFLLLERPERLRFTWDNPEHCPGTVVEVRFTSKPGGRVTVQLEHSGIESEDGYLDMKKGWTWAMDSCKSYLEKGKPLPYEEWERNNA